MIDHVEAKPIFNSDPSKLLAHAWGLLYKKVARMAGAAKNKCKFMPDG